MTLKGQQIGLCFLLSIVPHAGAWIDYPSSGSATLTHYSLPRDYVASCGCTPASTHYPTAALSQMAYGSSAAFGVSKQFFSPQSHWVDFVVHPGPACGKCFNLTLLNPVYASPPFHPLVTKSIVIKVTDLCPLSRGGWCSGTETKLNTYAANCVLLKP